MRNCRRFGIGLVWAVFAAALWGGMSAPAAGQLLKQDFTSSSTVSDYVSATPGNGQWNAISTSGAGTTVSITGNALQYARTGNAGSFSRTADFSPTPASIMYNFDLTVSGNSASQTTAAVWQVGSGYGTANSAESNANTHSRIGLNWTTTAGQFQLRDIGAGANSASFSGTQSVLWVINNSGGSLSYRAPDGTQETVGDDKADIWVGTTRALNEVSATTTTQTLTDLKFAFTAGTATVTMDNFVLDPVPGLSTATSATGITSTGFTANWGSVSGVTGYRLDVATDAGFTAFVSGYNNLDVGNVTSAPLSGLSGSTAYYYRVRAYDYAGAGGNSNTITATTTSSGSSSSDVISAGNETPNIDYAAFQSASIGTTGDGVRLWSFTIRDGGGSPDGDALATILASVAIDQGGSNGVPAWSSVIRQAALFDGAVKVADASSIGTTSIAFTGLSGVHVTAPDDGSQTLDLYVTFKSTVTDNQQFQFQITNANAAAAGGGSGFGAFSAASSSVVSDADRIEVTASAFRFSVQPPATVAMNSNFGASVEGVDANNNRDLDAATSVTLSASAGTLSSGAGLTQNLASGVFAWSDLQNNTAGTGVTLNAAGSLTTGTSSAMTILQPEPTVQASAVNFTSVATTSMTVKWTIGDGANRIVLMKSGSAVNADPADGASYTANPVFGSGSQIGSGNYAVYSGSGDSVAVTGLSPGTTYYAAVYEFNASPENYLAPGATGNQTTGTIANTFTWNGSVDANWSTAGNWSPARSSPSADDILVFNTPAAVNLDFTSPQTIARLQVTNNSYVVFTAGAAKRLNIAGAAGTDFQIDAGSTLVDSANGAISDSLLIGATGSVSGTFRSRGLNPATTATVHQLLAADVSGLTFQSGSLCRQDSASTGGLFGTSGTANTVVFAAGSVFEQVGGSSTLGGSNPFQLGQPSSKVTFQSGSLFRYKVKGGSLSLSGRTYANLEWDNNNSTSNGTGSSALIVDTLKVTNGTLGIGMTGSFTIRGDIVCNDTLSFNAGSLSTIAMSGSSTQTISGTGVLTFGANEKLLDSNAAGVKLGQAVTLNNTLTVARGIFDPNGNTLTGGAATDTIYVLTGATQKIDASTFGGSYAGWSMDSLASGSTADYSGASSQAVDNTLRYAHLSLSGAGAKTLGGAASVKGNLVNLSGYSGAGTLTLDGTGAQTVSGAGSFGNLTLNKTAGSASLGSDITEDATLTVTLGQLVTGSFKVTISPSGSLSEAGNGNVVIGTVEATRTVTGNVPRAFGAQVNEAFGNIGLEVDAAGGPSPGAMTVTRGTGTGLGSGPSIKRFYDISAANNTGLNATLVFHYDDAVSELNGNGDEATLGLWKSTDLGSTWSSAGGTVSAPANTITRTGVTSFSRWTASDAAHPMAPLHSSASDIVAGSFPVPSSISSLLTTKPQEVRLFQFLVRDGGGAPDTDAVPTIVKNLTLRKGALNTVSDLTTFVQGVDLFQGSTHIDTAATITANDIQWKGGPLFSVADDHVDSLNVYVYLKNPLPAGADGKVLEFLLNQNADVTTDGVTGSVMATVGADVAGAPGTAVDVTATQLAFSAPVSGTAVNTNFSAGTRATDANGNLDTGFGGSVTFSKASGPAGGTLSGGTVAGSSGGVASTSTLQLNVAGTYTLSAASAPLTPATSNSFVITGSAAPGLFKVAAGPLNAPSADGTTVADTLNWDSPATWVALSGSSPSGIPKGTDTVVIDNTFRAGNYVVRAGPGVRDSAKFLTIGYAGNPNTLEVLIPPQDTLTSALVLGDGLAGNYDLTIAQGGVLRNYSGRTAGTVIFLVGFSSPARDSVWIRTGGTLVHGTKAASSYLFRTSQRVDGDNGTVEFDVPDSTTTYGVAEGGAWYPNLVMSALRAGGKKAYKPTSSAGFGPLQVKGSLTVNPGVIDSIGAPFDNALILRGDLVNNGTLLLTIPSPLAFLGSSTQTVSGNPLTCDSSAVVANPAGVTLATGLTVRGGSLKTTGTFTWDKGGAIFDAVTCTGTVNTGASTISLDPNGSINEGTNPVLGNVSVRRKALQNSNQTFGGIGYSINASGGVPDTTLVVRKTGTVSTGNGRQSIKRYFDVTPLNNAGMNATVVFAYAPSELNGIVEASLLLEKSTNGGAAWSGANGTVNTGAHTITASGINSFSRWTAASVDSPLFVTHTITIRKYADADGDFGTPGDESPKKWRLSLYRNAVIPADSVAGGNPVSGVLTVPNLEAGSYIAVEADSSSSGWAPIGKIHHGSRVAAATRFDTIVVSGGVPDSADFVNYKSGAAPDTIIARTFVDADGDFFTAGDRTPKKWAMEVRDSAGALLGSANDTILVLNNLSAHSYTVREADSAGWIHQGIIQNGSGIFDILNAVGFSTAGGTRTTVDFINEPPDYSVKYRSFRPDSLAYDVDNKGRVGKFVKRKADKVSFIAQVVNDTSTVNALHMEFSSAILLDYPFHTVPPSTHVSPDGKNKKWDFTFNSPLNHGDVVNIHGFGNKGKPQKVSKYYWENGVTLVGTKKKDPLFTKNDPKLPMPNRVNALFETFAQTGFGANGLLIGRDRSSDSAKQYGWILAPKYTDAQKSLSDKTGLHTGGPRGFDTYTTSGRPILKRVKYLPPSKQNNMLVPDLITLKLNIAASTLSKTPVGFGELIYNDTARIPGATVNIMNGRMVREIASFGDSAVMGSYAGGHHVFAHDSVFQALDFTVQRINKAFEGAVDTIDFAVKLHFRGTKILASAPFLHANPNVVPAIVVPLDRPIIETPQSYTLYQNYPNPFNPTTTIEFDLVDQSVVTLRVYNILGQEVATLLDRAMLDDGTQEVEFNAGNLASGVYFYRLTTASVPDPDEGTASREFSTVKKMMLIK